ncbi:helix-turn-helix domain-containing protein [Paenibacillus turpanensis]|uniref:helix-turn-helix domain-containing protein n=1 Tax=Paenibacillus turpanensis TaxID=2689078 RepID=UPI00140E220B|nr:helix-turn-helix domain-containing protein [Paenibacillus turpanensis]
MQLNFREKLFYTSKQLKLSFFLTLLVSSFISFVSFFLYYDYRSKLDRELHQPNAELLQMNIDVTNRAFRSYDSKAVQLSFHPAALGYVTASTEDKKKAASELHFYFKETVYEEEIVSVYVVDAVRQRMVSSVNGVEYSISEGSDQSWAAFIQEMERKPLLIKRRTEGSGHASQSQGAELISLYRPIRSEGKLAGLVVVNLDYDRLFTTIHTQLKAPQYIFNLDGELIYPKKNLAIGEADMRHVVETLNIRPFTEVKLDSRLYLANQAFSDMTGWRWVSVISLDDLLTHARLVRNIIVSLSLLSILIGCIAIYYYSYTAYRPLKRIRELIVQEGHSRHDEDLEDIEQSIRRLMKEFDRKAALNKQSLVEIRSKYVQDVLFRRIGAKETQFKWQRYFQDWTEEPLAVVMVSINRYKAWSARFDEEDQLLLKFALCNLIHEIAESGWHSAHVFLDKENVVFILQPKHYTHHVADSSLSELFQKVIDLSAKYLHLQLSIGLGSQVKSVFQLRQSFMEAKAGLSRRLYEGYAKVIEYTLGLEPTDLPLEQANRWKQRWEQSIEDGNSEAAAETIEAWMEWIKEHRPAPESVYSFADEWMERLLHLYETHELTKPHELEDYTSHHLRMMDLSDLTGLLRNLSTEAAEGLKHRAARREYTLVQKMIEYMETNLAENIGLQQVADSVQMSTSSVSSMFKQETGYGVFEYLTKLRIEKACRLLQETDRKIADVASFVGYQNETSFIRSFRKAKGTTPGKYREVRRIF